MLFKIKLILASVISIGLLGALLYVQHLSSENEVLTINNANLESTVESWQKYAEDVKADSEEKSRMVRKRMNQIAQLNQRAAALSQELKHVSSQKVNECLAVRPGPDFVDRVREYAKGSSAAGAGADVSRPEPVRSAGQPEPHG